MAWKEVMPFEEEFITYVSQETPHGAIWGSTRFGQESERNKGNASVKAFTRVSPGKGRYIRENIGLAKKF